jgi:hypothetical protein
MELVMWIALAASATFCIAAAIVAGTRGLEAWRTFKAVAGTIGGALEAFVVRAEATAERAGTAAERTAQLTAAIGRLQGSLATLAVLDAAIGDARAVFGSVRGLVPRK